MRGSAHPFAIRTSWRVSGRLRCLRKAHASHAHSHRRRAACLMWPGAESYDTSCPAAATARPWHAGLGQDAVLTKSSRSSPPLTGPAGALRASCDPKVEGYDASHQQLPASPHYSEPLHALLPSAPFAGAPHAYHYARPCACPLTVPPPPLAQPAPHSYASYPTPSYCHMSEPLRALLPPARSTSAPYICHYGRPRAYLLIAPPPSLPRTASHT